MNKATFKTAQQLFEEAIDLPIEQRTSFVREKVSGDEVLYEVTCELLNNYEALPAYNDSLAEDAVMRVLADTDEPALPHEDVAGIAAKLPAFEILDKIGEGGMGGVYLAKRHGQGFEQTVAIKVLRDGLHSELARERFHQERQILAQLDHPAITRLIDGGSLDDDRPYLVMDYTPGLPITEYCEHNRLTVRQRLELFLKLTAAISHAHQNLVIHRDIKPPNILVGDDGQPHLLDFGIAKLQDEEKLETRTGMMVLTPDYASPEQISGKPVTVASDVYALGVLLYELLSGSRPYNWRDHSPAEFEKLVYSSTPLPPSSVEREGNARLRLTAELDNIVLKALHSDVEQRYHTVDELSADLQRLLNGEAVLAHPPGLIYRTRKFIGRHRLATAALSTIFVLISGFGTYSYLQSQELKIQRDQALREQQRAESVTVILTDAFSMADPTQSFDREVTANEVLSQAATLLSEASADDPELHARLSLSIAEAFDGVGTYQKGIDLLQTINTDESSVTSRIKSQQLLSRLHLSSGETELAQEAMQTALALRSDTALLTTEDSVAFDIDRVLLLEKSGQMDEAAELIESLMTRRSSMPDHQAMDICRMQAGTMLGVGEPEQGIQLLQSCLNQYPIVDGNQRLAWASSRAQAMLANLHQRTGDFDTAAELLRQDLKLRIQLFGDQHITPSNSMINLGAVLYRMKDYEQALELYNNALKIQENYLPPNSDSLSTLHYNLALTHQKQSNLDQARTHAETAVNNFLLAGRDNQVNLGFYTSGLFSITREIGDLAAAEKAIQHSIRIFEHLNHPKGRQLARSRARYADLLHELGRDREALDQLQLALPVLQEHYSPDNSTRVQAEILINIINEVNKS